MTDTITLNKDTTTDELVTVMKHVLGRIVDRIGTGATVGLLFGVAVLMTIEDSERHV